MSTGSGLQVLAARCEYEEEIKRSRFIARAAPLKAEADAPNLIASLGEADASHNCWAWRFGDRYRFDDDGEPGGTAGRPILQALDGHLMDRVALVVVRYFGGTRLGAGGLVRAYGGTASRCLDRARLKPLRRMASVSCKVPFETVSTVYALLDNWQATREQEHYQSDGAILKLRLEASQLSAFKAQLRDTTRGRVQWLREARELATD